MKALKFATLSSKGQTTIPLDVRTTLGLVAGDQIAFEISDGKATLRKVFPQDERDYLKSIELTLAPEWMSNDDDDL
jgi:AbrB family looped-hinge helix DNA binding protein